MKYSSVQQVDFCLKSAPTRGPWIEIRMTQWQHCGTASAPTRGPWIEIPL